MIKAVSKNEMEDIAGYGRQRLHDFDTPWCAGSAPRRNKANASFLRWLFLVGELDCGSLAQSGAA
ncbi:hypothetical protein HF282_19300 [Acidithiobacillus ferrooxidans]|nr:hypothetical protein [Acidithiobacillus ferrooxidans]